MFLRILAIAIFVMLAAVQVRADPLPRGFSLGGDDTPQKPVTKDGTTTFQIFDKQCNNVPYGDDRGESDCTNGNIRSDMQFSPEAKMGQLLEYRFDIRLNADFAYPGYRNDHAFGFYPGAWDTRLRIASWEGPLLHNFLYMIKADAKNGISFLARQCQAPEQFGNWVSFSMKVKWAADDTGWIKVTCDDRIVYADEGVATDQPPHCFITNVCEPDLVKHPKSVLLKLGPVMAGFGYEWKKYGYASPFTPVQKEGIAVSFRNIAITTGAVDYEEADTLAMRQLQEKLTELGCDPGPADGVPTRQTREAALSCRVFAEGTLPAKLTVATVKDFLAAYSTAGVAALPHGGIDLPKAEVPVQIGEVQSEKQGTVSEVASYLHFKAPGVDGRIDMGIIGLYSRKNENLSGLRLSLDLDLTDPQIKALRACGVVVDVLKRGGLKTEVTIKRATLILWQKDTNFTLPKPECVSAALSKRARAKVEFVLSHFRDIAIALLQQGRSGELHHQGAEVFFKRVALGEISVGT
ncbi:MAG: hypothetical protein J0H94_02580 [Rhizobiales bacterium]|nr:hypothetical protein [Hyphomicrobiales bacterium]